MIFNITTQKAAQRTLRELTGISEETWKLHIHKEENYAYSDDFVKDMLREFATRDLPRSYTDMDFVFFHITTSGNGCASIRKNGLTDLQKTYQNGNSELRAFLDEHGVLIDLFKKKLTYEGGIFKISFENDLTDYDDYDSEEYQCWSIGRKFFYDYTVCGFLSIRDDFAYDEQMYNKRPEILMDIDNLLGTQLVSEWERTHLAYKVIAKVSGRDICYAYEDEQSEEEKIMAYIAMAYDVAFKNGAENIVLIKNGVQIPAQNIQGIERYIHQDIGDTEISMP